MNRSRIRAALAWGVFATLLLPVVLAVVLGLGSLLAAVGDAAGSRGCGRVALAVAAAWLVALVATTATAAVCLLEQERPRPPRRRRRGLRASRRRGRRGSSPEPGAPPG